jgi:hypothetical protein
MASARVALVGPLLDLFAALGVSGYRMFVLACMYMLRILAAP